MKKDKTTKKLTL